jgi:hypothetical protein
MDDVRFAFFVTDCVFGRKRGLENVRFYAQAPLLLHSAAKDEES